MEKLARSGARANAPNIGNLKQHRRDPSLERKQIEFSLEINHFLQSEILLMIKKKPYLVWGKSMAVLLRARARHKLKLC